MKHVLVANRRRPSSGFNAKALLLPDVAPRLVHLDPGHPAGPRIMASWDGGAAVADAGAKPHDGIRGGPPGSGAQRRELLQPSTRAANDLDLLIARKDVHGSIPLAGRGIKPGEWTNRVQIAI